MVFAGLVALAAPWIAPHDPADADLMRRLQPPVWLDGGDWSYPLGCDGLGHDMLSRLIFGARVSLGVGFGVVAASTVIGTLLGMLAGFARRDPTGHGAVCASPTAPLGFPGPGLRHRA